MEDARLGAGLRAVRLRLDMTQADLALRAGVRRATIVDVEAGRLEGISFGMFRAICRELGVWTDTTARWRSADLGRLTYVAHDALQGAVLLEAATWVGWIARPEVSFSIYGERGAIDILAWHAATRTLLIIEVKTLLVDPAELVRTMDRRRRLGHRIAADQRWRPRSIATWVILTDTRTNRRHVAANEHLLAPVQGIDGRRMRVWLRSPDGPVAALSFWREPAAVITRQASSRSRRVSTRHAIPVRDGR